MRDMRGFAHLIEGWRNGPQVPSVLAELRCIQFLRSADNHVDMEFGPTVSGGDTGKRADILWATKLGEFLVEAKSLRPLESDTVKSANRLLSEAVEELGPVQSKLRGNRLDVVCSASGANFRTLLLEIATEMRNDIETGHAGAEAARGFVRATLRNQADKPEAGGPCVQIGVVNVGSTPTPIYPIKGSTCWLTVSLLLGAKLRRAVRSILGKARRQLRGANRPAIIYVEVDDLDAAASYLEEVMVQQNYAGIPLVIASDAVKGRLVSRRVRPPADTSLDATLAVLEYRS